MPWQGGGTTLDSIVEVDAGGFFGTGSVFCKNVGTDGNLWLGIVTADHVVRPGGSSSWTGTGHSILFGDNAAQGEFGRVGNVGESWYRQYPGADLAFLAINMGPANGANQAFYNNVAECALTPVALDAMGKPMVTGAQFTEYGYGGTGPFVAAGAVAPGSPAGIRNTGATGEKRFQNNEVVGNAVDAGIYAGSPLITWTFDQPAAAGNFLAAEGTSFGGDSGGPYMMGEAAQIELDEFYRQGADNPWGGGVLDIYTDGIFAIHSGANPLVAAPNGVAAYNRVSYGVPMMPEYVNWLEGQCDILPAPGSMALLGAGGLLAGRRRRG